MIGRRGVLGGLLASVAAVAHGQVYRVGRAPGMAVGLRFGPLAGVNDFVSSSQFSTPYWNIGADMTVTLDALMAPDGTMTADLCIPTTTATVNHQINGLTANGAVFTAGQTYCKSFYVKPMGYRYVRMNFPSTAVSAGGSAVFDLVSLNSMVSGAPGASGVINAGSGWYRIWLSSVATGAGSNSGPIGINTTYSVANDTFAGDGTSGIGLWGAQFELGTSPSRYLPKP